MKHSVTDSGQVPPDWKFLGEMDRKISGDLSLSVVLWLLLLSDLF